MKLLECILLLILVIAGVSAPLQKRPLITVISFTVFGLAMSLIWMLLRAPDLAITEAAVGVGIDTILFLLALRSMRRHDGGKGGEEP